MHRVIGQSTPRRRLAGVLTAAAPWRRIGASIALGMALASCASVKPAAPPHVIGSWYSPPAAYPGMCMTLLDTGEARFAGGFTFFNPSRWQYNGAAAELRLELGGSAPFPAELSQLQLAQKADGLLRLEEGKRALVYGVVPETRSIGVGGFVFYRDQACPAAPR